ncbi:coiled-coil-helix-coiled-coil-helix domain-containing protein 7 [Photinus pyralis]|uniref:coiled-coil-helix-coiled-coil-helix domain-containing protein 7 n=1 Tax=Photinus pyralis TaxID=7054 RepID=UPI0012675BCC|nr:coiled-coil-helix-coiled-coil-helix domain-containing protein 7 [Photinus pyralis]
MNYDQEKHNPCLKEQLITYKCLDQFQYNKEKCELEMYNYKECKSFWGRVRADRRRKDIKPYLPEVKDREKIKLQYMGSKPT